MSKLLLISKFINLATYYSIMNKPPRVTNSGIYIPNFLAEDPSSDEFDSETGMYYPKFIEYDRIIEELVERERDRGWLESLLDELRSKGLKKGTCRKLEILAGLTLGERFLREEEYYSILDLQEENPKKICKDPSSILRQNVRIIREMWPRIENFHGIGYGVGAYDCMRPAAFREIPCEHTHSAGNVKINNVTGIVLGNDRAILLTPTDLRVLNDSLEGNSYMCDITKTYLSRIRRKLRKIGFDLESGGYQKPQVLVPFEK